MLLAGGQGSRLGGLTRNLAKPAVSFCGKYRIIDFSLSNCSNSNIYTVGVLTQYKPFLLNSYIGKRTAWDLDNPFGGVHILPPYVGENERSWYKGTANAILQNMDFINFCDPDYVLIISGDHIYKMDYSLLIKYHQEKGSEITISTIEVTEEEASRFGIITVDENCQITRFTEKPLNPESNLVSMGVYIFNWSVLRQALIEDQEDQHSENDFGKNVIPKQIKLGKKMYAYKFKGYWRDVGTIESYYYANMESLNEGQGIDIFDPVYKVFSNEDILPPHYVGPSAKIENSLISNGCVVLGQVRHSILAPGVYVGEGAEITDSILLPHSKVHTQSVIRKTIVGESAKIMSHCSIGVDNGPITHQEGITVIEDNHVINKGTVIQAGRNIYGVC